MSYPGKDFEMKYSLTVVLEDPNSEEGMVSEIVLNLMAEFIREAKKYGNGYYLTITDKEGRFKNRYDLRYDKDFDENHMIPYIKKWAKDYWTGKNGSYRVKNLSIKEA